MTVHVSSVHGKEIQKAFSSRRVENSVVFLVESRVWKRDGHNVNGLVRKIQIHKVLGPPEANVLHLCSIARQPNQLALGDGKFDRFDSAN